MARSGRAAFDSLVSKLRSAGVVFQQNQALNSATGMQYINKYCGGRCCLFGAEVSCMHDCKAALVCWPAACRRFTTLQSEQTLTFSIPACNQSDCRVLAAFPVQEGEQLATDGTLLVSFGHVADMSKKAAAEVGEIIVGAARQCSISCQ